MPRVRDDGSGWSLWSGPLTWSPHSHPAFYALALMISINSGLREAPPTRKPSTSFWDASSLQVPPVTEPDKKQQCMRGDQHGNVIMLFLTSIQRPTDLRRWSSQSWQQPQTHWSSATLSVCRELPEPEKIHKEHWVGDWNHSNHKEWIF